MNHSYCNGTIVFDGKLYETANYNVSNETVSVIFDGKGGISGYALANEKDYISEGSYFVLFRNGQPVNVYLNKTVEMIGRRQTVSVNLGDSRLVVDQFLSSSENGVFVSYCFESDDPSDSVEIGIMHRGSGVKNGVLSSDGKAVVCDVRVFCANLPFIYENGNSAVYHTLRSGIRFETFFSYGETEDFCRAAVSRFSLHERELAEEFESIICPANLTEEQKALFYSAYYCSLENYKVKGDCKAFMAGHHYLLPMRSYYRDSYYTVLPMYRQHSEKVRNQIVTLARGISENGDCPSAVRYDFTEWWGNHYDSPSFFVMMLYDYVNFTKDTAILSVPVKDSSVLKQAQRAIEKLSSFADETGLLYKEGKFNKRDWADEVNRPGYVTYDELLYARALYCLSKLFGIAGDPEKSKNYLTRFHAVKRAINEILWDDALGYYVNFKDHDYTETNLSVDTLFAALFGIADKDRAVRMLNNMERMLETRNNTHQPAGDFGVMCVYPFYGRIDGAHYKSSQPYYYHNGANWPYLSAMYACAKRKYGMEYRYALESWFDYNVARGNYTPVEFFSPPQKDGSLLQAWNGVAAFVLDEDISRDFWN